MKGLNLLAVGDPVDQCKHFSGNNDCRLALHWHKERNQDASLAVFYPKGCCNGISFLIQAPITPVTSIKMKGIQTW